MSRSVVITGMGTVGPYGCGRDGLLPALRTAAPLVSAVDRSAGYHRPQSVRSAAMVDAARLRDFVPARESRRMSASSRYAVGAARMAWEDAGFSPTDVGCRCVVSMATALAPVRPFERILRDMQDSGPETTSPFLFTESVANAPAGQVAIALGAREGNYTYTQREAGPLIAVLRGAAELRSSRADMALVGAVDEFNPLAHAVMDRFGALARPRTDDGDVQGPFDHHRNGFLMGEGATVLLLEEETAARARGARILARIRGGGQANDPSASASSWGRDHELMGRALAAVMNRLSVEKGEVERIVSGASGAVEGDRLEALTLRSIWQAEGELPPVLAPKAITGEYGGGTLAPLLVALEGAGFGPTPGFHEPDPLLLVVPHDGKHLEAPQMILASAHASGGAVAWLFLEQP